MKRYFLTFLIFSFIRTICLSQDDDKSCLEGISEATRDYNRGEMVVTSYGLMLHTDLDFEAYYEKYLYKNYRISISYGGCIVTECEQCYSDEMRNLIQRKYGEHFFKNTRKEAELLYYKNQHDSIYVVVDKMPEFEVGLKDIGNYIRNELNSDNLSFNQGDTITYVQFVVDTLGRSTQASILKSSSDAKLNESLIKIIESMPQWTPGERDGKKVSTSLVLPIRF